MQRRTNWSQSFRTPQFRDSRGMFEAIKQLKPSERVIPKHPEGDEVPEYYMIRGIENRKVYGFVSPHYQLIQHYEIAAPLLDATDDMGITPKGRMYQDFDGRFHCYLGFEGDAAELRIDDQNVIGFGVHVWNGQNGELGWGAEGMGIRAFCGNGMVFGTLLGKFSAVHMKDRREGMIRFSHTIKQILERIPLFEKRVVAAMETGVPTMEMKELLIGAGLPFSLAEDIIAELPVLVPELMKDKVTGWTLVNGITAYASHNAMSADRFQSLSQKAEKMMVVEDYPKMVEKGRETIRVLVEKKKKA